MQKPTVGRVVWYHLHGTEDSDMVRFNTDRKPDPLAGIIVGVDTDTRVNLVVHDVSGRAFSRLGVLLHQPEDNPPLDAAYATWPARESMPLPVVLDTSNGARPLPSLTDDEIETRIRVAGADQAPRVTSAQIDALMTRVVYAYNERPNGSTVTFAHALLDGTFFLASGMSACVSAANYNTDIGLSIAKDNAEKAARDKLWELEGYRLRATMVSDTEFAGGSMAITD